MFICSKILILEHPGGLMLALKRILIAKMRTHRNYQLIIFYKPSIFSVIFRRRACGGFQSLQPSTTQTALDCCFNYLSAEKHYNLYSIFSCNFYLKVLQCEDS